MFRGQTIFSFKILFLNQDTADVETIKRLCVFSPLLRWNGNVLFLEDKFYMYFSWKGKKRRQVSICEHRAIISKYAILYLPIRGANIFLHITCISVTLFGQDEIYQPHCEAWHCWPVNHELKWQRSLQSSYFKRHCMFPQAILLFYPVPRMVFNKYKLLLQPEIENTLSQASTTLKLPTCYR